MLLIYIALMDRQDSSPQKHIIRMFGGSPISISKDKKTTAQLLKSNISRRPFHLPIKGKFMLVSRRASASGIIRHAGAVVAASNAALALVQLGDEPAAILEMRKALRRAPGSADLRAALAALYWSQVRPYHLPPFLLTP